MSFLVALGWVVGIAASLLCIIEFLKKKNASAIISAVVAIGMILAAIGISNLTTSSGNDSSGKNKPGNTHTLTITPQNGTPGTSVPTTPATITPTQSPTSTVIPTSEYSAALPGSICDTNNGKWTPQNLDGVKCPTQAGTELIINVGGTRGYLDFQLPSNQPFSSNNKISITGTLGDIASGYQTKCIGLAEQDANRGYSAEYCNTGQWFIYSIASGGGIIQPPLAKNVTNALTSATISMTLKGTTLSFLVDNIVIDTLSISLIQPTDVAIVYDCVGYGAYQTIGGNYLLVDNFSYITQAS